ncbi:MAG TPA: Crp/Fnr family transcriptional regulator [Pyrinomonadaceae bacterium]
MQEAHNSSRAASPGEQLKEPGAFASQREVKTFGGLSLKGLLANKLLSALPTADFARLLPHLEPVSLAANQELHKFGEAIKFSYFPENAVISHLHILADGATTEIAIIGREGMIGLSAILGCHTPSYVTKVLVAGSALRIRNEVLKQEFARGGAFQRLLLKYASARITQISQKAICNGRHKVDERFCAWLLMIQDRAGDGQLSLTQEQISRHLGARRAGVTVVAAALRDKGIISYRRGLIRILDRQALEVAACECYRTLHSLLIQQ